MNILPFLPTVATLRRAVLVTLLGGALAFIALPQARAQDFGVLTTLHTFDGNDGSAPTAALVQGSDGNFYGTTYSTVFRLTPSGDLTTLHTFTGSGDGLRPDSTLVQGSDGNFYGATAGYTPFARLPVKVTYGTVFRITPVGVLTTLYTFTGGSDGSGANGLAPGNDGNFYGTTDGLGYDGTYGTVFRVTPAGDLTTLHTFTSSQGVTSRGGVALGRDGNLYGTTPGGGANSDGTVFRLTPAGVYTVLYNFSGAADGGDPEAGLVQGSDGNFYGVSSYTSGVANDGGAVFRLTPAGVFTTLHTLNGDDGIEITAKLIQGGDGSFYGAASQNVNYSAGTVFKVTVLSAPTAVPAITGGLSYMIERAQPFAYQTTATNGPQSFAATGLPPGLTLDTVTGLISGTPTQDGTFAISLSATNSLGTGTTASLSLKIIPPPSAPVITSPTSATAQVGVPFSYQTTATNCLYGFAATGLPTGLTGDSKGLISGTPLLAGTFTVNLSASNSLGAGFAKLTLVVAPSNDPAYPDFFTGEMSLGQGIYYLRFPNTVLDLNSFNNNLFGYYSHLSDPAYLYHLDLGYEYVIKANDAKGGIYLYDFTSGGFFYTSPSFFFPYLYDFSLNSVVYYYPDPYILGRYNTNGVRYFYVFSTGRIISK